jgi:glycosyltransferase involved in cell wall biosynthesis
VRNLVFLSIYDQDYSRSGTYFSQIARLRSDTYFVRIRPRYLIRDLFLVRRNFPDSTYVVMGPSQYLIPLATLILRKRIVLDAGWSLFEATYISRGKIGYLGLSILKSFLIDFTASHVARKIILETELQKKFYAKLFLVSQSKLGVVYTGVDERAFIPDSNFLRLSFSSKPIVLFRGKYNPEAGLDVLARASHLLKDSNVTFWVFSPGLPTSMNFADNVIVDRNNHSKGEFAAMQEVCSLSLGQLANHPRLSRTIPHKAFESAYFATPYLTARSEGILELFAEATEIECFNPGDSSDLAIRIISLLSNLEDTRKLGVNMKKKYVLKCSQELLAREFLNQIGEEIV